MQNFAENLRRLRKQKGLTQDDMANLLQITRVTYGGYERDSINPPIEKMQSISKILGIEVAELFGATSEVIDILVILRRLEEDKVSGLDDKSRQILTEIIKILTKVEQV